MGATHHVLQVPFHVLAQLLGDPVSELVQIVFVYILLQVHLRLLVT